jgi:hypothetical protein
MWRFWACRAIENKAKATVNNEHICTTFFLPKVGIGLVLEGLVI